MKKLKLKLDGVKEMTKEEMKKINGGYVACIIYSSGGSGCFTQDKEFVCYHTTDVGECAGYARHYCMELESCCGGYTC